MQNDSSQGAENQGQGTSTPRPPATVEGTPDVTGQPGVESALGRDRTQGELPPELAANRGPGDVSGLAPDQHDEIGGSRVGELGDATGGQPEKG